MIIKGHDIFNEFYNKLKKVNNNRLGIKYLTFFNKQKASILILIKSF